MSAHLHTRRGRTYRDDFDSYRPRWRVAIETVAAIAEPIAGPLRRALRRRARTLPPLDNRLRRDIGLPPLPENQGHDRWR